MKSFELVNKLINEKIAFPKIVNIQFVDQEYLIQNEEFKINLGDIFYYSSVNRETLVTNESIFSMLALDKLTILDIRVDEINILRIKCQNCIILGFPREYEGWGIYVNGKQFAAHYGWENDLDWD